MTDDKPTNGVERALGRIEQKLDDIDGRLDKQDDVLELVRSHSENLGVSIATCQSAAAIRERRISRMEKQVRTLETTGVVETTAGRVRWRTLATIGAVLVSLVSAAAALTGMGALKCNDRSAAHHHRDAAAKKGR